MANLYLHIPKVDELWYRQQLMSDPDTMNYNKGYEAFEGYDEKTGCIEFPESDWKDWYQYFIGNEPQRFYAYVVRQEDNAFIGEVNLHESAEKDWHEMGIVLDAKYRGQGYSVEALKLLVEYGFERMHVRAIHNFFETERAAAVRTHLAAGFEVLAKNENMIELIIQNKVGSEG